MAWPIRTLTYTVDTVLLTAAVMLMAIVRQAPFVDSWLTMKVLLVLVYGFIITIARAHSPLGIFA